jgi:hypothetical protein
MEDFATALRARSICHAYDPIPVGRVVVLRRASFRPQLTTQPLRLANPSSPSSWIRDFHRQVEKHTWPTTKKSTQLT